MKRFLWAMILLWALTACNREAFPPGVVAVVNGEPITLRRVEALHDVSGGGLSMAQNPSVDLLREQYGAALFSLIVEKLMQQELKRLGHEIDYASVHTEEAKIRSNYPPGEFERVLQDDYIELQSWRDLLHQRLVAQLFQERVLRPEVSITPHEASAWYTAHKEQFFRPRRVELLVLMAVEKSQLEAAKIQVSAKGTLSVDQNTAVSQELRIPFKRLNPQWQKDLSATPKGKFTPIREIDGLFQCLLLRNDSPAEQLTELDAYPLIEEALVQEKLPPLFDAWLVGALQSARIQISPHLKPGAIPSSRADSL